MKVKKMSNLDIIFKIDETIRDLKDNLDFLDFKKGDLHIILSKLEQLLKFTEDKKVKK